MGSEEATEGVDSRAGSDSFVYADAVGVGGDDDLDAVRRLIVADAYARFRRQRGDAVLFAGQVQAPNGVGEPVERLRQRFEALGISWDWGRMATMSDAGSGRRLQRIFLELLAAGLIVQRAQGGEDGGWMLRAAAFTESCERGLESLEGWTPEAVEAQLRALGRVDGVEVEATILGGPGLAAFTPHADAVAEAAFVALSPSHPQAEAIATADELRRLGSVPAGRTPMVQTAAQAAVAGVEALLPVVVTPAVDARFGPTASLGVAGRDEVDREVAERLERRAGLPFRAARSSSKPVPAVRFRLADWAVSSPGAEGVPVPVVYCEGACGPVAADLESLPAVVRGRSGSGAGGDSGVGVGGSEAVACARCGGPARPDTGKIAPRFAAMWGWSTVCIPLEDREAASLTHPQLERWLPVGRVIWSAADASRILDQRIAAKLAGELGETNGLDSHEPFAVGSLCGPVKSGEAEAGEERVGSVEELERLAAELGADVARLSVLNEAAPQKAVTWSAASIRHAQRLLEELREYAEPRLARRPRALKIDRSTRLRRRLSAWCDIAEGKVSAHYEALQMHRATYDLMLFFKRIRDFEQRCLDAGGASPEDEDALAVALRRLLRVAAPCIPHLASELEAVGDREGIDARMHGRRA
jgi:leucyl-tRNA synthetase